MALTISALGVVFGDIGTSPLYALKECVSPEHGFVQNRSDLLGVLSLIFWSLMLVVTLKYLMFVMRAHNRGEGGIFALLALMPERMRAPDGVRIGGIALLALLGAALLCGEGVITPAISVLSAVEGLEVATPAFRSAVVPITCALLVGLFAIQRYGTGAVGRCFGPIMLLWFGTLAGLDAWHASAHPEILSALSPHHAARFFSEHGWGGGLVLGEEPDVAALLHEIVAKSEPEFQLEDVTFYLGRSTFLATERGGMGPLAEATYAFLERNAHAADLYFRIPPALVVELGNRIDL